jgi:hypothetical protein
MKDNSELIEALLKKQEWFNNMDKKLYQNETRRSDSLKFEGKQL